MAKCKSCKINIPEGIEYCKDCQDKVSMRANESYLDSLLNSVKKNPSAENIYKKKDSTNEKKGNNNKDLNQAESKGEQMAKLMHNASDTTAVLDEDDMYKLDFSDMEDFNRFNLADDLEDFEEGIVIKDEDLFGESLSDLLQEEDSMLKELDLQAPTDLEAEDNLTTLQQEESYIDQGPIVAEELSEEIKQEKKDEDFPPLSSFVEEQTSTEPLQPQEEHSEISEDLDLDLDLDQLLNSLAAEDPQAMGEEDTANPEEDMLSLFGMDIAKEQYSSDHAMEEQGDNLEALEPEQDDFLSLLGQLSDEDSAAEDIRAISDMLSGNSVPIREDNMPSNVGEVFSDALKAVTSLNDYGLEEEGILGALPTEEPKKGKKDKKAKKEKIKKEKVAKEETLEEKSKQGLFQRFFGNIKDDKTAAKFDEEQRNLTEPKPEKTKKAKGKAQKYSKPSEEDDDSTIEQKGGKSKTVKKADKKEKAEKKKKTKEVIEVIDEIQEDPGRINRVGASIVFFFFGIVAAVLIIGTNMITYTLSIQHAANYFNHRKYTQAYNEVYGVDIRDEDIGLYDKIQTVMFVNKQLNSYNNYYAIGQYPEALDSLLKGLSRYDKYIELATMLGIESDLDYVRSQILAELNNVFKLSEEEAIQILSFDSMEDYSLAVYDVVLEKMNN